MNKAKKGDRVKIRFNMRAGNGEIIDFSHSEESLEIIIGNGDIIPGIEKEIIGMEPGKRKIILVPVKERN